MLTDLAVLESTDWSRLHHAYARATDTPDYLRALLTEDTNAQQQALEHLWFAVMHQGTPCTATGPVALVIAGLLSDERIDRRSKPIRVDLLEFLVHVAAIAEAPECDLEELERQASYDIEEFIDSDDSEKLYEDEDAQNAFEARAILGCVKAAPVLMEVMLEGMANMNPRIRVLSVMGAAALARSKSLKVQAEEIKSRVMALARSAQHSDERSAHVLELGNLGIAPVAFLEDPSPAVRMCAALAPGLAANPVATNILLNTLEHHIEDIGNWFTESPPQFSMGPRFSVVAQLIERVPEFERLVDAAVAVARTASKYSPEFDWGLLLAKAFPDSKGTVTTDAQRRFLGALVDNAELWDPTSGNASWGFKKVGLPHDRKLCAQRVRKV
jgi:hypothetical protein